MTAAYHWLFVPLTLGLAMVMAVMETIYVVKKDDFWKRAARFWMKLFAVNFAVGIATGIILEFEFGTNWSNYSWFVGDMFGAPLAIEGILAFFMEATFFAVMFFGWDRVSKRFHLASTWLTGIGATISAYWILVANGWMQNPVGTTFNPDTVRSEMASAAAFWEVVTNPVAVFSLAGFNGTAYYPSCTDLQSSLTIANSSSSRFTLQVMFWVSLLIPFVLAYISYAWHQMDRGKISSADIESTNDKY